MLLAVTFLDAITLVHVAISLAAIAAGFVIVYGMLTSKSQELWHTIFLWTTVLTSATGFLFPFERLLPSHVLAVISLALLAVAIYARYSKKLGGGWRPVYVITAVAAFYLNFFVLIVQSFLKVPPLHDLAPTQTEPPFAIAQLAALVAFGAIGFLCVKRYRATGA